MTNLTELLQRWDSNEGKPYKGRLIDFGAFEADPTNIGCMCAQGQVLHLLAGWSPKKLRDTDQEKADKAVAKKLNISIAHSVLLRLINDKADGAPSVVLTHPEKILGDQARIVLAFWLHLDRMAKKQWDATRAAARTAARTVAWATARAAARTAARIVAWAATRTVAWDASGAVAWAATRAATRTVAWDASRAAAWACSEIQGARIMRKKGQDFFFLPMFGFADLEEIPPLPADYGVPQ